MAFSWILHVWKQDQVTFNVFVSWVWASLVVFCAACYKNTPVFCCDRAKSYWNVEVYVQHLSRFSVHVHIVERHYSLVKFKEMDSSHSYVPVFLRWSPVFWVAEVAELCLLIILIPSPNSLILSLWSFLKTGRENHRAFSLSFDLNSSGQLNIRIIHNHIFS